MSEEIEQEETVSEETSAEETASEKAAPQESSEQEAVPEETEESEDSGREESPAPRGRGESRRGRRSISSGIAHVEATFNNTKVAISDRRGNIIAWSSAGLLGYKGSRKSTSYVAQQVGADVAKRAIGICGLQQVEVRLKGPGSGRESAVRGLAGAGLSISLLTDVTPLPHNGCRAPKRRRV